ncbi:hypothetical protein AAFF_G00012550 [Aldrovandia affinis]|uniref:Uncharacterized protein n=1 Tax=Aldrovandia affinis TaxID=143900 RepID=A0AAD7S6I1_9TELE|nr:hypothetical protein AAFF_G00012550 [Aldrovandia affinis]
MTPHDSGEKHKQACGPRGREGAHVHRAATRPQLLTAGSERAPAERTEITVRGRGVGGESVSQAETRREAQGERRVKQWRQADRGLRKRVKGGESGNSALSLYLPLERRRSSVAERPTAAANGEHRRRRGHENSTGTGGECGRLGAADAV